MSDSLKTYVFIYSSLLSRDEMKGYIRKMDTLGAWRHDLPNCFYVVSRATAREISDEFRQISDESHGRFLIVEATDNKQGWLPKRSWHILNNNELSDD